MATLALVEKKKCAREWLGGKGSNFLGWSGTGVWVGLGSLFCLNIQEQGMGRGGNIDRVHSLDTI
jgi:hypothetical protein